MKKKLVLLLLPLFMVACGEVNSSINSVSEPSSNVEEVTTSSATSEESTTTSEDSELKYYTVSGEIKDDKNGVVPEAKVKLYNDNFEQIQKTNSQGQFTFENVVAGEYKFTITDAA